MKQRLLTSLFLLIFSGYGNGTAISMGNGQRWLDICKGETESYDEVGIDLCGNVLLSYMLGVIQQSNHSDRVPVFCSYPNQSKLSFDESLVKYLTENPDELAKEFMEVLPRFFLSSGKKCDKKGRTIKQQ